MASGYTPSQMDPSAGGGGSNWERNINNQDISTAKPVYNAATGQYEWQLPDGSRLTGNGAGQNGNSPYGPFIATAGAAIWIRGTLITAGTSGNLQLQWAQGTTTGGTPAVRKAGSFIGLTRVS